MTDSTTIRVGRVTRDHANKLSAERGETVDATVRQALDLLERERWRRTAELDAWAASMDEEDKAEVRGDSRSARRVKHSIYRLKPAKGAAASSSRAVGTPL